MGLIAMSPRRLLAVLAAISALLVPAAVAWACNPQGDVRPDKLSYAPGEQMTVMGSYFAPNKTITLTRDPGGPADSTKSTSAGTFQTQFEAPSEPGSYTLLASDGRAPARTTFRVASPSSTQPPPTTNNPPRFEFAEPVIERSRPGSPTPAQPQGDPRGVPSDPRPQPGGGGSSEPTTVIFQSAPAPGPRTTGGGSVGGGAGGGGFDGGGGSAGGGSGGGTGGNGGATSGENGVIRVPAARTVFVDSLAPADRRAGGAGRATTTAADPAAGRQPSERAATGDLWGGFRSGKAPALLPDGSADDGGPGASIGLALLGLGLVGLLSALAVAEARRRRALAG